MSDNDEADGSDLTEEMLRDRLGLPDEGEDKEIDVWIDNEIEHFQDDVDNEIDNRK